MRRSIDKKLAQSFQRRRRYLLRRRSTFGYITKAEIMLAVRAGLISANEVCHVYGISKEEFDAEWVTPIDCALAAITLAKQHEREGAAA